MNLEEAIGNAKRAAVIQGYEWSDAVFASRFRIWPWRPFWRISSRVGADCTGFTIVLVPEDHQSAALRVFRVRPWSDYDLGRVFLLTLLLGGALAFVTTLSLVTVGSVFGFVGIPPALIMGLLGGCYVFLVPILRLLGRDAWFLRRELRK